MNPVIRKLHEAQLRKDLPEFRPGDTVRVNVRLLEGEGEKVKERIQSFEGVVISKKGRASSATFTVRRVSFGTGVERIFPLHSPSIASIDVVGRAACAAPASIICVTCVAKPPESSAPPAKKLLPRAAVKGLTAFSLHFEFTVLDWLWGLSLFLHAVGGNGFASELTWLSVGCCTW